MWSLLIDVALLLVLVVWLPFHIVWSKLVGYPRRKPEPGYEYVQVEAGGAVFEVNSKNRAWLEECLLRPDRGGRDGPYFKTHYRSRSGGRIEGGFIERRKIPPKIPIGPAKDLSSLEQELVDAGIPLDG